MVLCLSLEQVVVMLCLDLNEGFRCCVSDFRNVLCKHKFAQHKAFS